MEELQKELLRCIQFLANKGWAPATSSNYSIRHPEKDAIIISQSGKDKFDFKLEDFMVVDFEGHPISAGKPSAETLLHTMIYRESVQAKCVLHTHTIYNTTLSRVFQKEGYITLSGYELLKGLHGVSSHEVAIKIPIFDNSQDMSVLAKKVNAYFEQEPAFYGFLLAGHGLYTWGPTIFMARRHVEVLEFLLECEYRKILLAK